MHVANRSQPPLVAAAPVALHHVTTDQVRSRAIEHAARPANIQAIKPREPSPRAASRALTRGVHANTTIAGDAAAAQISLAIGACRCSPYFQP